MENFQTEAELPDLVAPAPMPGWGRLLGSRLLFIAASLGLGWAVTCLPLKHQAVFAPMLLVGVGVLVFWDAHVCGIGSGVSEGFLQFMRSLVGLAAGAGAIGLTWWLIQGLAPAPPERGVMDRMVHAAAPAIRAVEVRLANGEALPGEGLVIRDLPGVDAGTVEKNGNITLVHRSPPVVIVMQPQVAGVKSGPKVTWLCVGAPEDWVRGACP